MFARGETLLKFFILEVKGTFASKTQFKKNLNLKEF
jgi:hypothetical protein